MSFIFAEIFRRSIGKYLHLHPLGVVSEAQQGRCRKSIHPPAKPKILNPPKLLATWGRWFDPILTACKLFSGEPAVGFGVFFVHIASNPSSRVIYPGPPNNMGPPKMVSGTHTIPIRIPKDMGIVWEAYHKQVPLLGVPENPIDKSQSFYRNNSPISIYVTLGLESRRLHQTRVQNLPSRKLT